MIGERGNPDRESTLHRVFLREPGWQVGLKVGSDKVFCYQVAPGESHYHRLADGEVYVFQGEEKLCVPCAERRGMIVFEPRTLREQMAQIEVSPSDITSGYDVIE